MNVVFVENVRPLLIYSKSNRPDRTRKVVMKGIYYILLDKINILLEIGAK